MSLYTLSALRPTNTAASLPRKLASGDIAAHVAVLATLKSGNESVGGLAMRRHVLRSSLRSGQRAGAELPDRQRGDIE